jgi:hypothetical protein
MRKQRGMGFIGVLLLLVFVGAFALLSLKLLPIYLESFKVQTALESLKGDPDLIVKGKEEVLEALERRFEVDDVEHVSRNNIEVQTRPGGMRVRVVYEVRGELVGNLDFVAKFDKSAELAAR